MKPLFGVGMAAAGGVIAMMGSHPQGAPPKLIMSVLPKLQAQNEQIIAMWREQNELLRAQRLTAH